MMIRLIGLVAVAMTAGGAAVASGVCWDRAEIRGSMPTANAFFRPGEEMRFVLSLEGVEGTIPPDTYFIDWERRGDDGIVKRGREPLPIATKVFPIVTRMDKPGFVCVEANVVTADGKKVPKKHRWEKRVFFQGGAAVEPWKLRSAVEPKDFDAFWTEARAKLDAMPMDVLEMRPCVSSNAVDIYAVKIACPGPHPLTGYLTVPKDVREGRKYPANVFYMGAGTAPQQAPTKGWTDRIRLAVNTQGYDLGRDQAYYDAFFKSLCPHKTCPYDRCPQLNKSRHTAFVYGLALRAIRAVDYVSTLPGCNGTVNVEGGSQGGFQAAIAVARAKRTPSKLSTSISWGLDWSGITLGRLPSTYRVTRGYEPELDYFDPCLHAKRIKCPVDVSNVGLGDYCSPPSSLTVFYNNLTVPKRIRYTQGSTHGWWPKDMQTVVFTNALPVTYRLPVDLSVADGLGLDASAPVVKDATATLAFFDPHTGFVELRPTVRGGRWVFSDERQRIERCNPTFVVAKTGAAATATGFRAAAKADPFLRPETSFRVSFPDRVAKRGQLRGVMLPDPLAVKEADFKTLRDWGATLVRYQMNGGGQREDVSDAENLQAYDAWLAKVLAQAERVLDWAGQYGMEVVIDLHSPPGGRYKTLRRGLEGDYRCFHEKVYADKFLSVWKTIAERLRGQKGIYGFDLVNEPLQHAKTPGMADYRELQHAAAKVVRSVIPEATIVFETNVMDDALEFARLRPLPLDNVVYQFHFYRPHELTHRKVGWINGADADPTWPDLSQGWDRDYIRRRLDVVRGFAERYGAKVYCGEFSAISWSRGAARYLADVIAVLNEYKWDWTYHAFREWDKWSVEHGEPSRKRVLLEGLAERIPDPLALKIIDPVPYVKAAVAAGRKEISIPKGVYRVRPETAKRPVYFTLEGVTDTVIDFNGSELLGELNTRFFELHGCTNVTIRNVTMDFLQLPFTQAVIEKADTNGTWDVRIVAGYPDPGRDLHEDIYGGEFWPLQTYDPKTYELKNPMRFRKDTTFVRTGEGTYRIVGGIDRRGEVGEIAVWSVSQEGRRYVDENCVVFDSANVSWENVTQYATPYGRAFMDRRCSRTRYVNCRLIRRPPETDPVKRALPRLRSGNHDFIISALARRGPIADGCVAEYHCDDCFNITANGSHLLMSSEGRVGRVLTMPSGLYFGVGDSVQVVTADGRVLPNLRAVSIERGPQTSPAEHEVLKTLGFWPGMSAGLSQSWMVTFDRDLGDVPKYAALSSEAICASGFEIRNCRFGSTRARGMLIKAANGIIENCTVEKPISLYGEYEWLACFAPRDITIRNCRTGTPIAVGSYVVKGRLVPVQPDAGIVLENNVTGIASERPARP